MDKTNSLRLYPNPLEMRGDPIEIETKGPSFVTILYHTKISRFEHVEEDPLFSCTAYTADYSYNDCVQDELLELLSCY